MQAKKILKGLAAIGTMGMILQFAPNASAVGTGRGGWFLYDDIMNNYKPVRFMFGDGGSSRQEGTTGGSTDTGGSTGGGSTGGTTDTGHQNNGHGNNVDGVDTSNPGKTPWAIYDTNPAVDDEGTGGGALPGKK